MQNICVKTQKKSKNNTNLAILFIISTFVFVGVVVAVTTAYFSNTSNVAGSIQLGELDFSLTSNCVAQNNILLPNSYVGLSTSITNSRDENGTNYNNLCKILYNFSVYAVVDDQIDDDITQFLWYQIDNEKYIQDDNGTFYYVGFVNAGENEVLFDNVFLDSEIGNEYQGKELQFFVNINAIQAENDAYKELWNDAPDEWLDEIENILI